MEIGKGRQEPGFMLNFLEHFALGSFWLLELVEPGSIVICFSCYSSATLLSFFQY